MCILIFQVTKQAIASSSVKVHTSAFVESNVKSVGSISQHRAPLSNNSTQSAAPRSSLHHQQPHGGGSSIQSQQHFSTPLMNSIVENHNSTIMSSSSSLSNSKSSPNILPLPQVKTSLPTTSNLLMGRSPVMASEVTNSLFTISPMNTSNVLPSAKTPPSPQIDSLHSNDLSYVSQPVKNVENTFIGPGPGLGTSKCNSSTMLSSITTTNFSHTTDTLNSSDVSNLNSVMLRSMPSPPPYSVAISRPWDTSISSNSLLDLTPSLTDLKPDELDHLLPTLELNESPLPDLPDDFLNVNSNIISPSEGTKISNFEKRKFLVNPLTGELELQSSDESDQEEQQDVFTGLRSPAAVSDEDTCSTSRLDPATDQSDNELRSSVDKMSKLKNSSRDRDSPSLKQEKIKLRLKLEKSEPINPAYKVRFVLKLTNKNIIYILRIVVKY